jgi:ubiquinone/menaquinone biosynthesis C-methylase UbiE
MKIGAVPENLFERLIVFAGLAPTPIIDTFHAVVVARAIIVATKLGVFDAVAARPRSAAEMAGSLSVDAEALAKLNNLLVAIGYLKLVDDRYAATRLTRKWLLSDSPQSLHDSMLLRFLEWEAIEATEDFVRTGKALDVHERITGEQWGVYQRGMRSLARLSAREVAGRVRLPAGARAMLDIGGGHGFYAVAFCRAHPKLQATILDLPEAVATAAPILAEERMDQRVTHKAGDALTEDLGDGRWDLIFISHLVHHFDAADNQELVGRTARGLRPGGVLAILDVLRQSGNAISQTGALLDLYFATTSHSGTWSREEITHWSTQVGLKAGRPIHLRTAPGITTLTFTKPGR